MARKDFAQPKPSGNGASPKAASKAKPAAAKKPKKAAAPAAPSGRKPIKLAIASLIAIGGLSFLLYSLVHTTDPIQAIGLKTIPQPQETAPQPAHKPSAPTAKPESKSSKERFQFYEMLPKNDVKPRQESAYHSTPKTAPLPSKVMLQVGSFRNSQDADSVRAKLILGGLTHVTTSRTEGKNGVWYRVRTGPFNTQAEVDAASKKILALNMRPLVISLK